MVGPLVGVVTSVLNPIEGNRRLSNLKADSEYAASRSLRTP